MKKEERDLLIKSLDSELTTTEDQILQKALEMSEDLRKERGHLLEMRDALKSNRAKFFSGGFEDRVMAKIQSRQAEDFMGYLLSVFKPVAIAAILLIIITASINVWNSEQISLDGVMAINDVSPEEAFNPLIDLAEE
jgi:anti-sigma factor RsiW